MMRKLLLNQFNPTERVSHKLLLNRALHAGSKLLWNESPSFSPLFDVL